jgi:enoyl-[acyl-carrier-protein] reductase (NADH)
MKLQTETNTKPDITTKEDIRLLIDAFYNRVRNDDLYELGPKSIRVHAISPGPLKTRAASGLKDFDLLLNEAMQRAPLGDLVDIEDVGFTCAYLATPFARRITGTTMYVDGGVNIMA